MTLSAILLSLALLLFAYIVFRYIVKNDYLKKGKLSPLSYLLETLVFALHANSFYLFTPTKWPLTPPLPDNGLLIITATLLFFFGLSLLLIAWFQLGTKTSFGIDKNKLKTRGLYRLSRNPQLTAYTFIIISFIMLYFTPLLILWLVLYIIISAFMIKTEEQFLRHKYKNEYKNYCRKTPRIL